MEFDWCIENGELIIGVLLPDGTNAEYTITKDMLVDGLKEDCLNVARERTTDNLAQMQEWSDYKMWLRNLVAELDNVMTYGVRE